MPGFNKALKIVGAMDDLTDEDLDEALAYYSKVDSTYGLLWGDLSPRGRQRDTTQLKLLSLLSEILQFARKIRKDETFILARTAYHIKVTQEVVV
ncbi:hypothetical protein ES702_03844 [subsurface metagenome]